MTTHYELMIDGIQHTDNVLEVTAPFDGKLIASLETADSNAVDKSLETAYELFRNRSKWLPLSERIAILDRAVILMQARSEELACEAAREGGKPLRDSRVEVARAIDGVRSCVEHLHEHAGRVIPMGLNAASSKRIAYTQYEPIGPVVAISAFNHPLNLIVHQVAPAIAAGNPVIVKPAEDTPISCYRFVSILHEAGLPPAWCQALVVNDIDVAEGLVTDDRVGFLSFIGSSRVGWALRSKLAPGARCALEHGGAAPVVITESADIARAIPLVAKGGFYHAGQVCVSVQRIYCHKKVARDFAEQLGAAVAQLQVGDPLQEATDVGPLIRSREVDRIHEWVTEAIKAGADCIAGGSPLSESCYSPTVIFNAPDSVRVSQQEIFGPVVCVYPYSDIDNAINNCNALPFSFQAAVFTSDLDQALFVSNQLDASAVMVNDHTAFRVDWMPFAGLRQSGLGVGGIANTLGDMQVEKMTVIHSDVI